MDHYMIDSYIKEMKDNVVKEQVKVNDKSKNNAHNRKKEQIFFYIAVIIWDVSFIILFSMLHDLYLNLFSNYLDITYIQYLEECGTHLCSYKCTVNPSSLSFEDTVCNINDVGEVEKCSDKMDQCEDLILILNQDLWESHNSIKTSKFSYSVLTLIKILFIFLCGIVVTIIPSFLFLLSLFTMSYLYDKISNKCNKEEEDGILLGEEDESIY